ncbi:hypothetical protein GCM10010399_93160 [Dactylosporangium fulvum]|uniref:Uncharacterized protein n=1 Tax=Dactylosporangium fulvum TaxID=53359 RepID=A0ABY5VQW0_9ACTN|nr:hypothetical protein [Dactylosporangium fulvum]UWP79557.1 hypothetical protein Dfulv_30875 [Dactylosporangium fulvum]
MLVADHFAELGAPGPGDARLSVDELLRHAVLRIIPDEYLPSHVRGSFRVADGLLECVAWTGRARYGCSTTRTSPGPGSSSSARPAGRTSSPPPLGVPPGRLAPSGSGGAGGAIPDGTAPHPWLRMWLCRYGM